MRDGTGRRVDYTTPSSLTHPLLNQSMNIDHSHFIRGERHEGELKTVVREREKENHIHVTASFQPPPYLNQVLIYIFLSLSKTRAAPSQVCTHTKPPSLIMTCVSHSCVMSKQRVQGAVHLQRNGYIRTRVQCLWVSLYAHLIFYSINKRIPPCDIPFPCTVDS